MKAFYKLSLALAAVAAISFVSCNKDDKDEKASKVIVPEYQAAAQKITFSTEGGSAQSVTTVDGKKLKSIEFTESGLAIIITEETSGAAAPAVRGPEAGENVIITTYTFKDDVYIIDGFGKVKITNATATVTVVNEAGVEQGEQSAEVNVETPEPQSKETFDFFCTWTVDKLSISAKGGSLGSMGVGKIFKNGADLEAVADFLSENGVNMPDEIKGYSVKDFTLTRQGTFIIRFKAEDKKDFYGSFGFEMPKTGDVIAFNYKFDMEGNSIINAEAEGSITPNGSSECTLLIKGNIKNGNDEYTTEVEFDLVKVAKAE